MVYACTKDYLSTCTEVKEKIAKLDIIILAMYDAAERAVSSGEIEEYMLDDGQTKIRNVYTSVEGIVKGIKGFETLRTMYVNRLQGRSTILRDFRSNRY